MKKEWANYKAKDEGKENKQYKNGIEADPFLFHNVVVRVTIPYSTLLGG
jgi:hypothetical protein